MALPSTTNKSKNNHYLLTDTEFANTPISDFSDGDEIDVYQAGGIPKADLSSEVQNTLNAVAGKSTVSVSATGTATDEVGYITIDGQEKKIAGGGGSTLYQHNIFVKDSLGLNSIVNITVISSSATAFTSVTFCEWLYNSGYNTMSTLFSAVGGIYPYGIAVGIYAPSTSLVNFCGVPFTLTEDGFPTLKTWQINGYNPPFSFIDKVVEIS